MQTWSHLLRLYIWIENSYQVLPFLKPTKSTCQSQSQGAICLQLRVEKMISMEVGTGDSWDNNIFSLFFQPKIDEIRFLPMVSTLPNPPSTVLEARIHVSASIPQLTINKGRLSNKLLLVPTFMPEIRTTSRHERPFSKNRNPSTRGRKPLRGE